MQANCWNRWIGMDGVWGAGGASGKPGRQWAGRAWGEIGGRGGQSRRVVAARMPGVAAEDPLGAAPRPADRPVTLDRFDHVLAARGGIAAMGRQQWADAPLVKPHEPDRGALRTGGEKGQQGSHRRPPNPVGCWSTAAASEIRFRSWLGGQASTAPTGFRSANRSVLCGDPPSESHHRIADLRERARRPTTRPDDEIVPRR